jgi:hypothetical protein
MMPLQKGTQELKLKFIHKIDKGTTKSKTKIATLKD